MLPNDRIIDNSYLREIVKYLKMYRLQLFHTLDPIKVVCVGNFPVLHSCIFLSQVQQKNLGVSGRIFAIESIRARVTGKGNILRLKVNFLPEIITLSKEVRNLKWLGFRVPLTIVNKAYQASQLYPFAISLIESVRTYERTCEKVSLPLTCSKINLYEENES